MLTRQEVFDKAAKHLLTQGVRAIGDSDGKGEICQYRGLNGTKCAAGALIDDQHYDSSLERRLADETPIIEALRRSGVDSSDNDLVSALQMCHDDHDPADWFDELRNVAIDCAVSDAVVDQFERASRATNP